MKNKIIISIVLAITLSIFPMPRIVYADDIDTVYEQDTESVYAKEADMDKFKKSVETVKESTENLKDILGQDTDIKAIIDTFDTFSNVISVISTGVDTIGSVVSFLQLIGVIKGPNDVINDINVQVTEINSKMNEMKTSLDNITNQMNAMQASIEFKYRATQATTMKNNWDNYITDYEEKMSALINENYNELLTNGIKNWVQARREDGNNNSNTNQVIVWYKYEDGEYVFKNTYANSFDPDNKRSDVSIPSPFVIYSDEYDIENDKYLILDSSFLPPIGKFAYEADTYRKNIINHIKNRIETFILNEYYDRFIVNNYTEEEIAIFTEEEITKIAEDAFDALIYRIIYNAVNSRTGFSSTAINRFRNYCTRLLTDQQAIDAMLKWLYLTHAFQFQVKDEINNFIDSMILKVGMYGMFLTDTVFLSRAVSEAERNEVINLFSDTIEKLETMKKNAIFKNYDNYSYITNTVIYLGEIEFHGSVNLDWSTRGTYASYRGASNGNINHRTTRDEVLYDMPDEYLLGDVNALVLAQTLQSNGVTFNYDFMRKNLLFLENHPIPDKGVVVTSLNGQKMMNDATYLKLNSDNVLGGYFEGNPSFYMNNTPGKSELEYFQIRNMMTGTIFDTEKAILNIDKPLLGIGVYGEDHGYWIVDECAVFSGASTNHYSKEREDKYTGTDFIGNTFKTTTHNAHSVYNCLLSVPERRPPNDLLDPLESFRQFMDVDHASHDHEWKDQSINNVDGVDVVNYRCENGDHLYSELDSDEDYVELTFDLNGGTLNGSTNNHVVLAKNNSETILTAVPEKLGYEFVSWDNYKVGDKYLVNGAQTLKAVYKQIPNSDLSSNNLYYFVAGQNIQMKKKEMHDIQYHIKRSLDDDKTILHLKEVKIGNRSVNLNDCVVEQGSLVLTINKDYLRKNLQLEAKKYNVTFIFDDSILETTLEITETKSYIIPETGIE